MIVRRILEDYDDDDDDDDCDDGDDHENEENKRLRWILFSGLKSDNHLNYDLHRSQLYL